MGGEGQDGMSLVILGVKVVVREMQVLALEVFRTGPRRDSMSLRMRMRMRMSCPVDDFLQGMDYGGSVEVASRSGRLPRQSVKVQLGG